MRDESTVSKILKLGIAIGICLLPGLVGTPFTDTDPGSWYQEINRPDWEPPGWVFGPVWSLLYILTGISLYLIWTRGDRSQRWYALIAVFMAQLVLNASWTPAFFGLESPGAGLAVIIPLALLLATTIALAWRFSTAAALLLVPYLAWVVFATALNFSIWQMN